MSKKKSLLNEITNNNTFKDEKETVDYVNDEELIYLNIEDSDSFLYENIQLKLEDFF